MAVNVAQRTGDPNPSDRPKRSGPSAHLSFRLYRADAEALERRAAETGQTKSALAERYIHEGLRLDEHLLIAFRDGATGRLAALAGTRLYVWQVIETVKNSGNSVDEAAAYLGLAVGKVRAAVRYYAANRAEIDQAIDRMHRIAEREEEAWRREKEVLA